MFFLTLSLLLCGCKKCNTTKIKLSDSKGSLDSFIYGNITVAINLQTKVKDSLLNDSISRLEIDSIQLSLTNCYLFLVNYNLAKEHLSFIVLENRLFNQFYLMPKYKEELWFKESMDKFNNPYKNMAAYQDNSWQGLENYLNESDHKLEDIKQGFIDTLFTLQYYSKEHLQDSTLPSFVIVRDSQDVEITANLYLKSRLAEESLRKTNIPDTILNEYKENKKWVFLFLNELISYKERSHEYEYHFKAKHFVYFNGFFYCIVEIAENKGSQFRKQRFRVRYTVI